LSIAQNDPFSDHRVRQTMAVIVNAHAPSFARAAKIQFALVFLSSPASRTYPTLQVHLRPIILQNAMWVQ
jgi:hypothetical protein